MILGRLIKEGLGLRIATLNGLTIDEAAKIQRESKWPLEAIKALNSTAEYNIYKDASLVPTQMTDGTWTFLNANSQKKFAEFHYVFKFDDQIIDYNYKKNEKQILVYEKLLLNNEMLFEYEFKKKTGYIEGVKALAPLLNWVFIDIDSILKYVINNTVLDDSHPIRQLMRFVSNMLWFRSLDENRYIGYKNKISDYFDFIFEKDYLKEFENFLHTSGIEENLKAIRDNDGYG